MVQPHRPPAVQSLLQRGRHLHHHSKHDPLAQQPHHLTSSRHLRQRPPHRRDRVSLVKWRAQQRKSPVRPCFCNVLYARWMLTFSVQRCSSRLLHRPCHRRFLWWRKQHSSARSCISSAGAGSTASISVFRPATATRSYGLRERSAGVQEVHGRESGKPDHLWMVLGSTQGLPGCGKPILRAEGMQWHQGRRLMKRAIPYEHKRNTLAL